MLSSGNLLYLVCLSITAILAGPLLLKNASKRNMLSFVDGFSFCFAVLLLLLHLIPESVEQSPTLGLLFAMVGFALPGVGDMVLGRKASFGAASFGITLGALLVAFGLAIHGTFDGYALSQFGANRALIIGILIHRLPIGIVLWRYGVAYGDGTRGKNRFGPLLIGSLCIGTAAGAVIAAFISSGEHTPAALFATKYQYAFQALVGGGLLHVILARPLGADSMIVFPSGRLTLSQSGLGAIVAIVFFFAAVGSAGPMATKIFHYAMEASVGLVAAFVLSGILPILLERDGMHAWMSRGGRMSQSIRGMIFGLPLPICSCGVLPMYRSLIDAGVPASTATSFLISTPEVGFDSMLLSVSLLGWPVFCVRMIAATVVSFFAGVAMGGVQITTMTGASSLSDQDHTLHRHHGSHRERSAAAGSSDVTVTSKISRLARSISHFGFEERFVDIIPWVLAGFVIAAFVDWAVPDQLFRSMSGLSSLLTLVALATPAYVCASGATPLAASMLKKGLPLGSVVAFLLSGPSTNVTTFGVFNRLHGRLGAVRFAVTMVMLSIVCGLAINHLIATDALASLFDSAVDVTTTGVRHLPEYAPSHAMHVDQPVNSVGAVSIHPSSPWSIWYGRLQWSCLFVLLIGVVHNLLRVGPRGFASALVKMHASSSTHGSASEVNSAGVVTLASERTGASGGCCD